MNGSEDLLDQLADEVLTQFERQESGPLNWGIVGGYLNADQEIYDILANAATPKLGRLWTELQRQGFQATDILKSLLERKLLFESKKGLGYRTRYAETVRLLYLLKQRFSNADWMSAPSLISHIKSQVSYRRYPRRTIPWDDVKKSLAQSAKLKSFIEPLKILLDNGHIRMAAFQRDALLHLLESSGSSRDYGTIIAAGTGAGKTKAFYLPALSRALQSIRKNDRPWVRVLCLYPRTELLKDQFKEAVSEITNLNDYCDSVKCRPLTVGAYYGATPPSAQHVKKSDYYQWHHVTGGYVCPFLSCPSCNADLLWADTDLDQGVERLRCANIGCGFVLGPQNIALTRRTMEQRPPDLVFSTTEMLNRKLTSLKDYHVFGLGPNAYALPTFVLLDEVHIYHGVTGANVSYVLRRWRRLAQEYHPHAGIHFAGLSATLPNAETFFSQLVGIDKMGIRYITPRDNEMDEEGAEYNLVLRGDPFSATALLSSTVQVAMLMGRMLDPLDVAVSRGSWGSKIFGFTDKLDLINRWFHIEQDAEERKVLSQYRYADAVPKHERDVRNRVGQVWSFAEAIDPHSLRNPLKVDITSSQQKGVDPKAKLVIATSTLEVGYNDTAVGAVIQHKAPRNLASFMQRKGRAGRQVGMRPWTLVLTSAYGRDRYTYDYPEQLFSPLLPDLRLPIHNPYVQRIHAAFGLMDWLGTKLRMRYPEASVWNVLTPSSSGQYVFEKRLIRDLIQEILSGDFADLRGYLKSALQVTDPAIDRILWTPPRSILLDLLPRLFAHLSVNWEQEVQGNRVVAVKTSTDTALRGYVPNNLFTSLDINELEIILPDKTLDHQFMGLPQGMAEFAPGNVSKRYVNVRKITEAHWLALPDNTTVIDLSQTKSIKVTPLESVQNGAVTVLLPEAIEVRNIPKNVSDRSTGFLQWNVEITPHDEAHFTNEGRDIVLPRSMMLNQLIERIAYWSSSEHSHTTFVRYAQGVETDTRYTDGRSVRQTYMFEWQGQQAGVGFRVDADALQFQLRVQDLRKLVAHEQWSQMMQEFRAQYYAYRIHQDEALRGKLSVFERQWLLEICTSSAIATAVSSGCDIPESIGIYRSKMSSISTRTLEVIFQSTLTDEQSYGDSDPVSDTKLYKKLVDYIEDEALMKQFIDHLDVLHKDLCKDNVFWDWVNERLIVTVAASIQSALINLVPDLNVDELLVDIHDGQIWLSESESGGLGIIAKVASAIANDPVGFEEAVSMAIDFCPRKKVASSLDALLPHLKQGPWAEMLMAMRATTSVGEQKQVLRQIQWQLTTLGISPRKDFLISLMTRFVHGNANQATDAFVATLHEFWRGEEKRLNLKIDARVFTVACVKHDDFSDQLDNVIRSVQPGIHVDEKQRFHIIESLLWENCFDSCPECLDIYSPYQSFLPPSRALLRNLLGDPYVTVDYATPGWEETVRSTLGQGIRVRLQCAIQDIERCQQALLNVVQSSIELDYELFFPYVAAIHNRGTQWDFELRIREVSA